MTADTPGLPTPFACGVLGQQSAGRKSEALAIDLFCGLGGWTEGLLASGYRVIGFDLERHEYGEHRYPARLVLQDVRTLHGQQFRTATLIVASPPCQEYSYMAMPWKRGKRIAQEYRDGVRDVTKLTELFDACFRIQREACEAAGRHIPMVVENVCGAQKWVGKAQWHYGSYYLWGDVPALMPITDKQPKVPGFRFDGGGGSFQTASVAYKSSGMNWSDRSKHGQDFTRVAGNQAIKNTGGSWFNVAHNTTSGKGRNPCRRNVPRDADTGIKCGGDWVGPDPARNAPRWQSSKSPKRKAASALIAKIPFELASYIANVYKPCPCLPIPVEGY